MPAPIRLNSGSTALTLKSVLVAALVFFAGCASPVDRSGPDRVELSAHALTANSRGWGEAVVLTYDISLGRGGDYHLAVADDLAPVPQRGAAPWAGVRFHYSEGVADSFATAVWALLPDAALADSLPVQPPGIGGAVVAVVENGRRRYLLGGTTSEVFRLLIRSPAHVDLSPGEPFEVGTRAEAWPPPLPLVGSQLPAR